MVGEIPSNRCNSLTCTVRTSRQRSFNQNYNDLHNKHLTCWIIWGKSLHYPSIYTDEYLRSASILKKFKIKAEVVDLRSLRPLDSKTIIKSVKKTKNVLIIDNGWMSYGIGSEIMARIFKNLKKKEKKIFFF